MPQNGSKQKMTRAPHLNLTVQYAADGFAARQARIPRTTLIRWVKAALFADAQLTLRFVGMRESQYLNRTYRSKDKAANVLTFSYPQNTYQQPSNRGSQQTPIISDLVLCHPIIEQEAVEQNKMLKAHYAHLIVHGVLHAQGYDHSNDDQANEMESLEVDILQTLGFSDPYQSVS